MKTVGSLIDTALIIKRQVTTWGKNTGQHINTGQQYIYKQHTYIKQNICNRVCEGLKKSAWFINRQNMWRGMSTNTACDNTYTGTWCCLNLSRNTFKPLQQECKITSPGHAMG